MPDPGVSIDFAPLGNALVQAIADHIGEIGTAMWDAFGNWLYGGLRVLFLAMFQMTMMTIPHALTDQFGPVTRMMPNPLLIAGSAAALSMILLGLKVVLQRVPLQTAIIEGVLGRIVVGVATLGAMPWLVGHAIDIEQQMAESISMEEVTKLVTVTTGPPDFTQVVALLIMIFLGIRLWFKLAANVAHIATAMVWSPLAGVCSLFPQSGWVASMWWQEILGRLAGAVLATIAVGIGLALALGYPGLLSIAGGGGAFMAATDLVDWLAKSPGHRMGGVLGLAETGVRAGMAMAGGGGAVSAGAQAAGMRTLARSDAASATERFYGFD